MDNQTLIELFNKTFPVGSTVRWRILPHEMSRFKEYTVKTPAYDHHGKPVARFVERAGLISIEPKFVDYAI